MAAALWVFPAVSWARTPLLESLNAQRAAHGIPAGITENPDWSNGCALHVNYMKLNSFFGHDEVEGNPGYTKEGDDAGNSSVLASAGWPDVNKNPYEYAPIHLMQLLSPQLSVTGFDDKGICTRTWSGYQRDSNVPLNFYSYPGPGTTNWRTEEYTSESPFTPAEVLGLSNPTGPHIYLFPFGNGATNTYGWLTIKSAVISGPDGPVDSRLAHNKDGTRMASYLPVGAIAIPVKPLKENTTYTVTSTWEAKAPSGLFTRAEAVADINRIWDLFGASASFRAGEADELATPDETAFRKYWDWVAWYCWASTQGKASQLREPYNKTIPADSVCNSTKPAPTDVRSFTTGKTGDNGDEQDRLSHPSFLYRSKTKGRRIEVGVKIEDGQQLVGQKVKFNLTWKRGKSVRTASKQVTLKRITTLKLRSPFRSGKVLFTLTGNTSATENYQAGTIHFKRNWRLSR